MKGVKPIRLSQQRTEAVDTWPASSRSHKYSLTSHKSVEFLKNRDERLALTVPLQKRVKEKTCKPVLLSELEEFLKWELKKSINQVTDDNLVNESRLAAFKQCFDQFCNEFTIYKPLLKQIQNEYTRTIDHLLYKLHNTHMIETRLKTIEREDKEKMEKLKDEFDHKTLERTQQIKDLDTYIFEMKEKHSSVDKTIAENEKKIRELTMELKDAIRSRGVFYTNIKYYSQLVEDSNKERDEMERKLYNQEKKLIRLDAAYNSVVSELATLQQELDKGPSPELLDGFKQKTKVWSEKAHKNKCLYQSLMDDYQKLRHSYDTLIVKHSDVEMAFRNMKEEMERPQTPRPDWDATENTFVKNALDEQNSTRDLVAQLLTQNQILEEKIEKLQSVVKEEDLEALQMTDDVKYVELAFDKDTPKYLRYKGKIRSKRIPKGEVEDIISSIWEKKYSFKKFETMPLHDFIYEYFRSEYGNSQKKIAEVSHNFFGSLKRYRYDADCELFLNILNDEFPEAMYLDSKEFLDTLLSEMETVDKKLNGDRSPSATHESKIPNRCIEQLVRRMCPAKNAQKMDKLMKALSLSDPYQDVRYRLLFEEDTDGNQCPFMEEIREQLLTEYQEYITEISDALKCRANEYDSITVNDIRSAFEAIDPQKASDDVDQCICAGFGVTLISSVSEDLVISREKFMTNLNRILVKRTAVSTEEREESVSETDKQNQTTMANLMDKMMKQRNESLTESEEHAQTHLSNLLRMSFMPKQI